MVLLLFLDEGAWLILPVLVLLAPLAFSALSQSSNSSLCLLCFFKLVSALFLTFLNQAFAGVFLFIVGKILQDIASGLLSHLLSEILSLVLDY